jgi:hypothetical protein
MRLDTVAREVTVEVLGGRYGARSRRARIRRGREGRTGSASTKSMNVVTVLPLTLPGDLGRKRRSAERQAERLAASSHSVRPAIGIRTRVGVPVPGTCQGRQSTHAPGIASRGELPLQQAKLQNRPRG